MVSKCFTLKPITTKGAIHTGLVDQQLDLFDQPLPEVVTRLTFNQAMRFFRANHWDTKKGAAKTDSLCRYMVEFFDGRFIDLIGRQDTVNLLNWLRLKKGAGAWYLIRARGILRLLYNRFDIWKEDGAVGGHDLSGLALPRRNPTFKVPAPQPPKPQVFLSPFEHRGWIRAARGAGDLGFEAAFKLGLWFRLSPIDLENLNDDEIDEQAFEIRIQRRHTITEKTPAGAPQVIKLTEKAWALIERCRRYRKPGDKMILPIRVNKRRRFAKIRKLAVASGLRDMTLSVLRRSASDFLLERNFPVDAVSDALGHTTDKIVNFHYSSKKRAPHRGKITTELVDAFGG